ncbi:MAG: hypothetical protein QOI57_1345 [Rubrobacteraceae bacterium]|nr:hypothetical protein [Rubrobacteraceae bacterium]
MEAQQPEEPEGAGIFEEVRPARDRQDLLRDGRAVLARHNPYPRGARALYRIVFWAVQHAVEEWVCYRHDDIVDNTLRQEYISGNN